MPSPGDPTDESVHHHGNELPKDRTRSELYRAEWLINGYCRSRRFLDDAG
jgi:hypothetical protein